jgi:hypothetical protein
MRRRRRWNLWAGPCALLVALSMVTGSTLVPTRAVVSGGIIRCTALGEDGPRYAAGIVTVLKGRVTWRKSAGPAEYDMVLPTTVVEREAVRGTYRFDLAPGQYVLESGVSYASVTLDPGDDLHVDIQNMCI